MQWAIQFKSSHRVPFSGHDQHSINAAAPTILKGFVVQQCASRAFWLVAYPSQGHEMLFDAHTRSFAALGGVPRRGIYDNMKTAVDKEFSRDEAKFPPRKTITLCIC